MTTNKPKPLAPMQQRFVEEYLLDLNATQAAIRAGYAAANADKQASQLLGNPRVAGAVAAAMEKRAAKTEIKADRILRELATIGLADMRNYVTFGKDGDILLDFSGMPEEATRAISEITQEEFLDGRGDDARTVRRTKFKLHAKTPALELLGKHLAMWVDRQRLETGTPVEIRIVGRAAR